MKNILLLITIIILFLLQACTTKKPEISSERLVRDISGKSVEYKGTIISSRSFVWTFDAKKKLKATNIRPKYNEDKAEIIANVENEYGYIPYQLVEYNIPGSGDILFKYEWINNNWELMKIENISFTELPMKEF